MRRWLPVLLLSCRGPDPGCAEGQVGDRCESAGPETGEPVLPTVDPPATQATWGPADIEAAIEATIQDGFPDVWTLQEAYLDFLAHGDELCPGHDTYIDSRWLYGCTAESGYWYSGVSKYWYVENILDLEERTTSRVGGDFEFRDPTGHRLMVGGGAHLDHTRNLETNDSQWDSTIHGSWSNEAAEGWFRDGMSGMLNTTLLRSEADAVIELSGAIGFSGISLYTEQLRLVRSCDWEMTGELSIRDPGGDWHEIVFGDDCTPCGEASFDGQPTGSVCLDLQPIAHTFELRMGVE